jgi:hypothetical protein
VNNCNSKYQRSIPLERCNIRKLVIVHLQPNISSTVRNFLFILVMHKTAIRPIREDMVWLIITAGWHRLMDGPYKLLLFCFHFYTTKNGLDSAQQSLRDWFWRMKKQETRPKYGNFCICYFVPPKVIPSLTFWSRNSSKHPVRTSKKTQPFHHHSLLFFREIIAVFLRFLRNL